MNKCLSIVIPLFNAQDYLPLLIGSLYKTEGIEQTEILIVDDGSTDGSGQTADALSEMHPEIRVLHKENEGPSAARNMGLLNAEADYVFFCDADDTVDHLLFADVIKEASTCSCDAIIWDSELIYETWNLLVPKNRGFFAHEGLPKERHVYNGKDFVYTLLQNSGDFVATVWLGAYRKSYLIDNAFFFEKGLIHEDELWAPKVYLNAESILYIPEKVYRYRIHKGSIMNPDTGGRKRSADSLMQIYPSLYEYYDQLLEGERLKTLIEGNLTKRYLHMIYKYRIFRYGYGKMIDKKRLVETSVSLRHKIMALLLYLIAR